MDAFRRAAGGLCGRPKVAHLAACHTQARQLLLRFPGALSLKGRRGGGMATEIETSTQPTKAMYPMTYISRSPQAASLG